MLGLLCMWMCMWMWYGAWIWALGYDAHGAYSICLSDVLTWRASPMAFPAASPSWLFSRLLVLERSIVVVSMYVCGCVCVCGMVHGYGHSAMTRTGLTLSPKSMC